MRREWQGVEFFEKKKKSITYILQGIKAFQIVLYRKLHRCVLNFFFNFFFMENVKHKVELCHARL